MNCEQNGKTFNVAPVDLYVSKTSGIIIPLRLHADILNTGMSNCLAVVANMSSRPFLSGMVKTPTISYPLSRYSSRTSAAKLLCPMMAIRSFAGFGSPPPVYRK